MDQSPCLPISSREMAQRGWPSVDFGLVTGDSYVDHPTFGAALIARWLESHGYRVGILPQPRWNRVEEFCRFGRPRLGFLVTAGNLDSLVSNYSGALKKRPRDAYSPGGVPGNRPDRASIVYTHAIRRAYGSIPVILGGIEASLRRFAHYDYWENRLRPSLLIDSAADLIVYGMGEKPILEIADALAGGLPVKDIVYVEGTVFLTGDPTRIYQPLWLPPYDDLRKSKSLFARSFLLQDQHSGYPCDRALVESYGDRSVVQNPPPPPLTEGEMDRLYALPFSRQVHPSYRKKGGIPAFQEVRFSLTSHRGCFGHCRFCSLSYHQGRSIQTRSVQSLIQEARHLMKDPAFKGYLHDVGGPTANFLTPPCPRVSQKGFCPDRSCLTPQPCPHLRASHRHFLESLRQLRSLAGVKKVFVRSGLRYDYLMLDPDETLLQELCGHHISGQLKVAPEHVSEKVLELMGKPGRQVFDSFEQRYQAVNRQLGMKQYLVPYLMSSHPGSTIREAVELAEFVRDLGHTPQQVQDFYPTPGTQSTCMYYTGLDPVSGSPVYVPRSPREKAMQRALIHFKKPENRELVREALIMAGRRDLIGWKDRCLIPATRYRRGPQAARSSSGGRAQRE